MCWSHYFQTEDILAAEVTRLYLADSLVYLIGHSPDDGGLSQSLKMVVDWAVWGRISQRSYEGSPA